MRFNHCLVRLFLDGLVQMVNEGRKMVMLLVSLGAAYDMLIANACHVIRE